MKKVLLAVFLLFITSSCIYANQSFKLQFPVKCQINKNCWVLNYVDDDSSPNWHDYKKGRETYDGHTGTDIAIKDVAKMQQGVEVVAAASGFVVATRDGVPDKNALAQDTSKLQNIGCGNRVAIKHAGGWLTDYCHMKNGSIKVKKGDFVSAGQTLGLIGMSGLTEFPHLHINVQQGDSFFDPFTGAGRYKKVEGLPLWSQQVLQQLSYKPLVLYNVGISDDIPTILNIREGKYQKNRISFFSNMLIVWLDMFHVEVGDLVSIEIRKPNGGIYFKQNVSINKANARKMFYVGKKKPQNGFEKGTYKVQISFKRPSQHLNDNKSFDFNVY